MRGCPLSPIDYPYLTVDYDRHGNIRRYVRMPGKPKFRIRAEPGTEEFATLYWACRKGEIAVVEKPKISPARPGSFRWIAQHYLASRDFKALDRRLTQRPRQLILNKLIEKIGDKPAVIDVVSIREGVRSRGYGAAKEFLSCLRAVYRVAMEDGLVGSDPTVGIRAPRPKVAGWHTWTLDDCAAFEKRWPVGTKQHTAYALGIYTGQRISDAVKLGRVVMSGGRLKFTQVKNRKSNPVRVDIPIVPPLSAALAGWQGKGLTFLETEYGQPYSPDGLSNAFRRWCDAAGLSHCSFHGLRKACATRMAEAGCTPHEIMAVLGHSTHQQASLYTRAADRSGMADNGLARLFPEQIVPPVEQTGSDAAKLSR